MNNVFVITLYKIEGNVKKKTKLWAFDDPCTGLVREPFVPSASEVINKLRKRLQIKSKKQDVMFSETFIPDFDTVLTLKERHNRITYHIGKNNKVKSIVHLNEFDSGTYLTSDGDELWLCPAQLKYFGSVANQIFVKLV